MKRGKTGMQRHKGSPNNQNVNNLEMIQRYFYVCTKPGKGQKRVPADSQHHYLE